MHFTGSDGTSFDLHISGYQFPGLADQEYDSNWLRIQIRVTLLRRSWAATDQSLLTYEVRQLADWLDALDAGRQVDHAIGFTEPNLSFACVASPGAATCLRVHFAAECRPPWEAPPSAGGADVWAEFPLAELDLHAAAESLRAQLRQYPQRTEH